MFLGDIQEDEEKQGYEKEDDKKDLFAEFSDRNGYDVFLVTKSARGVCFFLCPEITCFWLHRPSLGQMRSMECLVEDNDNEEEEEEEDHGDQEGVPPEAWRSVKDEATRRTYY